MNKRLTNLVCLWAFLLALSLPFSSFAQNTASSIIDDIADNNLDEMLDGYDFVDLPADSVIQLLEELTGKVVIRRQDLPMTKISFNSRGPLSRRDSIIAIESLLTLNGVMITEMGGRYIKAVPAQDVSRHVPEMITGSTLELEPSQQIYAKLFRLEYLNVDETAGTIIAQLASQQSNLLVFTKSNSVLVTDALINLQRIEALLQDADRPQMVRGTMHFIQLKYVQVAEMQQRIDNLIKGPLRNYLEGNTSVTADERTNKLIVITHPENMAHIQKVIDEVDVDAAPLTGSEVFPLRQAVAADVVAIIENIITGQQEGREEDAQVSLENNAPVVATPTPQPNQPTPNVPVLPQQNVVTNNTTGGETSKSLQFSDFVGLSADERTNSIVAYGTNQDLETLRELIEKIDIPLPQVLIEAVITEVTLAEDQASGLSSFGFSYDGATDIFSGISVVTSGLTISDGTVDLNNARDFSLSAVVSANDTDSDTRILSTPRIVVSHNEEGIINVSQSQPIITSSTSTLDNNNNTRSTVEYRDIGIQLTVTPLIGADGTVQMSIEQTVENVVGVIAIDGNDQPIIGVREATSTVSVKDNQVIVLAGLQQNSVTKGGSHFPVIRKIPIVNKIFGTSSEEFDRTELIIFIRPRIIENPAVATQISDEYIETAEEKAAVIEYLDKNTTGDLYMDGSKFKAKDKNKFFKFGWDDGNE